MSDQLIFHKGAKNTVFSVNGAGTFGYTFTKGTLTHTCTWCKYWLELDYKSRYKR